MKPRTRKYIKGYRFLSFSTKYKKQLLDKGLNSLKNYSKKEVHKTGDFKEKNDTVSESNDHKVMKQDPIEEVVIPPEKREEILNDLRQLS